MPMIGTLGTGTAKAYGGGATTLLPPVPGYVAWYTGESWTGSRWNDLSGNQNHVTSISGTVTATQSNGTKNAPKRFNIIQGSTSTSLTWPTGSAGSVQAPTSGSATGISFYATGGVGTSFTTTNPPFGVADNTADAGWILNTGNSSNNFFVYDLGANYNIAQIGFYSTYTGGARGGTFQIDYSTDGSSYTSGPSVNYSTSGGGLYTYSFTTITARYFKVYCTAWTNTHAPRTATVQFYLAGGSAIPPSTYTLFHFTRYNGTEGRIFSGTGGTNWLSGFWSSLSGQAFHMGWLTNNVTDYYADNWVLSTDQNSRYRGYSYGNSNEATGGGGSNAGPSMVINGGSQPAEVSDFQIAEILVYNTTLSSTDYVQVENYFKNKYNIIPPSFGVDYLVVGAGGGGGGDVGGGGGGGQVVTGSTSAFSGVSYTITVGSGGSVSAYRYGGVGGNSVLATNTTTITAVGGSGGQGRSNGGGSYAGGTGFNGGGGSYDYSGTSTYSGGFAGGSAAGAGGGATGCGGGGGSGAIGPNGSGSTGGNGGAGVASSISGSSVNYGGGGAGGSFNGSGGTGTDGGGNGAGNGGNGAAGSPNRGGGGGGGGSNSNGVGGTGGSGVVILRYPDSTANAASVSGATLTVTGGYRIYTFTGSGSITF